MNESAHEVLQNIQQVINDYLGGKETKVPMYQPMNTEEPIEFKVSDEVANLIGIAETTWDSVESEFGSELFISPKCVDSALWVEYGTYTTAMRMKLKTVFATNSVEDVDRWLEEERDRLMTICGSSEYSIQICRIMANLLETFRLRMYQQLGKVSDWPDNEERLAKYIDARRTEINCRFVEAWDEAINMPFCKLQANLVIDDLVQELRDIRDFRSNHHARYAEFVDEHDYETILSKIVEWKQEMKKEFTNNTFAESYYYMLCKLYTKVSELVNYVSSRGLK